MSKLSSEEKEVLDLLRGSGFSLSSGVSGMENELRSLSLASSWGVEGDRFSILWSVQLQLSMAAGYIYGEKLFWIYQKGHKTRAMNYSLHDYLDYIHYSIIVSNQQLHP